MHASWNVGQGSTLQAHVHFPPPSRLNCPYAAGAARLMAVSLMPNTVLHSSVHRRLQSGAAHNGVAASASALLALREKELTLLEKELALREKELALQEKENELQQGVMQFVQQTPSAAARGASRRGSSPASELRQWMAQHAPPSSPTPAELHDFIESMPLSNKLREVLIANIYPVPSQGLFVCSTSPLPQAVACPRQDVVQELVKAARRWSLAYVACIGGRRHQGKSFSNPWAQVEAISLLEGQPNQPAPRSQYVFFLSCLNYAPQPTTYEQTLLLATLAFLRIPAVFDEFSHWSYLPAAVESFLSGHLCRPNLTLSLRPLQFVLQDSTFSYVRDVLGGQGILYGRTNLGVLPYVQMPQPSIHLVAGILKAHHPSMYPSSLLRIMSTHGRLLHQIASTPQLPLLEVGIQDFSDLAMVKGAHLSVMSVVMAAGAAQIRKLKQDAGELQLRPLVDEAYVDLEPRDSDNVVLSDPVMITRHAVQEGISAHSPPDADKQPPAADAVADSQYEDAAEQQLAVAEAKVLEVLARKDLVSNILEKLGFAGKGRHYLWWGWLGPAKFDALIYFPRGPVILVSSKRTQAEQSEAAFIRHIDLLQGFVKKRLSSSSGKGVPLDVTLAAGAAILKALTTPGSELIMVGLSAIPSPNHQLNMEPHLDIDTADGQRCQVACRYVPLLLEQLVQPVPYEMVTQAMPLNTITP